MAQRWRLSTHARERSEEMRLNRWDVLDVILNAELDHTSLAGTRVAKKGQLAVVYNPEQRRILTVLWNTTAQYERKR